MTLNRIFARDRRMAAVHEAGHVVIASSFGLYPTSAWICPSETNAPSGEKTWIGRVQILTVQDAEDRVRRMVGVAGSVAELCWRGEYVDPDYWTEPEMMSLSDWRLSGCEPGHPDQICCTAIEEVGCLFDRDAPAWASLIAESRRLIGESRPIG